MSHRCKRSLGVLAALLALALGGCGGGGGDESASTSSSATQSTTATEQATEQAKEGSKPEHTSPQSKEKQGSKQGKGEEQGAKPRGHHPPATPPPISSAAVEGSKAPAPGVKTAKGGDNSVQGYGVESSDSARTETAIVLQSYLDARLQEDWGRACSYLSPRPKEQLEQSTAQGQSQGAKTSGCAGAMAVLAKGVPSSALAESAQITKVLSFRVEGDVPGDPSFLLYLGLPEQTLYSMPMYLEGGEWKVGLVLPSALPV